MTWDEDTSNSFNKLEEQVVGFIASQIQQLEPRRQKGLIFKMEVAEKPYNTPQMDGVTIRVIWLIQKTKE